MARAPSNRTIDSDEFATEGSFIMPATGKVLIPDDPEILTTEAMAAAGANDYLAQLAFMEEKVMVTVHESTNKNDDPMPMVAVNGVNQYFVRGQNQLVKRKFVEVLARAKPEAVMTDVQVQGLGAEPINRVLRNRAHKFPFSVIEDRNPRGGAWLSALLREDQLAHA